jgi:hypothetical protein
MEDTASRVAGLLEGARILTVTAINFDKKSEGKFQSEALNGLSKRITWTIDGNLLTLKVGKKTLQAPLLAGTILYNTPEEASVLDTAPYPASNSRSGLQRLLILNRKPRLGLAMVYMGAAELAAL